MKHIIVSLALGLASGAYADEEPTVKDDEKQVKDQHTVEQSQEYKSAV